MELGRSPSDELRFFDQRISTQTVFDRRVETQTNNCNDPAFSKSVLMLLQNLDIFARETHHSRKLKAITTVILLLRLVLNLQTSHNADANIATSSTQPSDSMACHTRNYQSRSAKDKQGAQVRQLLT